MGKDVHSNTGMCPWPIGSHLFNDGQNPGEIWGGTTWEQIKERFPLGCGDTHAAGTSGGEFEHQLTTSELPSDFGNFDALTWAGNNFRVNGCFSVNQLHLDRTLPSGNAVGDALFTLAGGNQPHNITPPPIWRSTGGTESLECVKGVA